MHALTHDACAHIFLSDRKKRYSAIETSPSCCAHTGVWRSCLQVNGNTMLNLVCSQKFPGPGRCPSGRAGAARSPQGGAGGASGCFSLSNRSAALSRGLALVDTRALGRVWDPWRVGRVTGSSISVSRALVWRSSGTRGSAVTARAEPCGWRLAAPPG